MQIRKVLSYKILIQGFMLTKATWYFWEMEL